jgi:hypothetical protein
MVPGTAMASSSWGMPGPDVVAVNDGTANQYQIWGGNFGLVAHDYADLGSYETTDAVSCADVYALPVPNTKDVDIYAMAEGYCQGDGTLPRCTEVDEYYG